jgi:hypothetical protein
MLYLYAPDGETVLAFNDDAGVGSSGPEILVNPQKQGLGSEAKASRIVYNFSKAGQYYIMVKDFDRTAYGTARRYEVLVSGGPAFDKRVFLPVIISDF